MINLIKNDFFDKYGDLDPTTTIRKIVENFPNEFCDYDCADKYIFTILAYEQGGKNNEGSF